MNELEHGIHHEVNRVREEHGLRRLETDDALARVARDYSCLMAEKGFFSHHAPVTGMEDLEVRVLASGEHYDGLGENLAMHPPANASATDFVNGWMTSPGHRQNLLTSDWEVSGVGACADERGYVFATQLFGIPAVIALDDVRLETKTETWYSVRVNAHVGSGNALGAFVRNRFIAATDADVHGRAQLECEVATEPGQHHIAFGRRKAESDEGWIGIFDGVADIGSDGSGVWRPAPRTEEGYIVHEDELYQVTGSVLTVVLTGYARQPAFVVVDGTRTADLGSGPFETTVSVRAGTGTHTVDIGLPDNGQRYRVVRRFRLDADRGAVHAE